MFQQETGVVPLSLQLRDLLIFLQNRLPGLVKLLGQSGKLLQDPEKYALLNYTPEKQMQLKNRNTFEKHDTRIMKYKGILFLSVLILRVIFCPF